MRLARTSFSPQFFFYMKYLVLFSAALRRRSGGTDFSGFLLLLLETYKASDNAAGM